jgi:phosphate transport system permease protein
MPNRKWQPCYALLWSYWGEFPTVVYGYFALLFVTPVLRHLFPLEIFNALSAGLMMGIMITPTVGSISLDAIQSVPRSLREGSYALGITKLETIFKVVLPAALSGIMASIILGVSRAVGETMTVLIAAGSQPRPHFEFHGIRRHPDRFYGGDFGGR